jgi:SAM-dependent methyltransferase
LRSSFVEYCKERRRNALCSARIERINSYLTSHKINKLQLGSGENILEGWLNTDLEPSCEEIIFLDVLEVFPLEDQVFDYAFSEHLIEHISYQNGLSMLQELFRILKPGGKARIATPNILRIIELFHPQKTDIQMRYLEWSAKEIIGLYSPEKSELQIYYPEMCVDYQFINQQFPDASKESACFIVNSFFRCWGHRFLYDPFTLQRTLEGIGFVEVTPCEPGESGDEHLRGIDSHAKIIREDMNDFETMIFEGTRPKIN